MEVFVSGPLKKTPNIFDELLTFFYTNPLDILKIESLSVEKINSFTKKRILFSKIAYLFFIS